MTLTEHHKTLLTRLFIALLVGVIIGIYYLSELRPFAYADFESKLNEMQRYNAELNAAIVQTRFGQVHDYKPIHDAIDGLNQVQAELEATLKEYPNPRISEALSEMRKVILQKEDYTKRFMRINPIFMNAIQQFSSLLEPIIDSEENIRLIEGCSIGDYKPILLDKANDLFRGILLYVSQRDEKRRDELLDLVDEIRGSPQKLAGIEKVLPFDDQILALQPQLSEIDVMIFEIPITNAINALHQRFYEAELAFSKREDIYHIILYTLSLLLIVVLRWAFIRLQNTVNTLHVEVKRKIKAQKELAAINQELEQRVADRTQELTEKNSDLNQALGDLKEAQDQLIMQEKMASVGMLTTGIAHEIKNPLNFVNNFSDISVELVSELGEEFEKTKEALASDVLANIEDLIGDLKTNFSKIKEHGERADNIVKTMLMHSQGAAVDKEMIDLNLLLSENIQIALDNFRSNQGQIDIKLEEHFDESLEKIVAAPQTLGRAFIYILDNALYALKEKQQNPPPDYHPTLTVSTEQKDDHVMVIIKDNGTGIAQEELTKLFEPFYTTKPTGRGNTGLGLSICYDTMVKQHKGEVRVTSEQGKYTEFTVDLPIGVKRTKE